MGQKNRRPLQLTDSTRQLPLSLTTYWRLIRTSRGRPEQRSGEADQTRSLERLMQARETERGLLSLSRPDPDRRGRCCLGRARTPCVREPTSNQRGTEQEEEQAKHQRCLKPIPPRCPSQPSSLLVGTQGVACCAQPSMNTITSQNWGCSSPPRAPSPLPWVFLGGGAGWESWPQLSLANRAGGSYAPRLEFCLAPGISSVTAHSQACFPTNMQPIGAGKKMAMLERCRWA